MSSSVSITTSSRFFEVYQRRFEDIWDEWRIFCSYIMSIVTLLGSLGGERTSNIIGRKWTMVVIIEFWIITLAPLFSILIGLGIEFGIGFGG